MRKIIIGGIVFALLVGAYFQFKDKLPWLSSQPPQARYKGSRAAPAEELVDVAFFNQPSEPKSKSAAKNEQDTAFQAIQIDAKFFSVNPAAADVWEKERKLLDAKNIEKQLGELETREVIKLSALPRLTVINGETDSVQIVRQAQGSQSQLKLTVKPEIQDDGEILMDVAVAASWDDKKSSEMSSKFKVPPGGYVMPGSFDFEDAKNFLILKTDILE
jgi:hypothetical protein